MKQFLYRVQPVREEMLASGPTERESGIISDHFEYLKELTRRGTVLCAGRTLNTDPSSFGFVVLQVESEEDAGRVMAGDPAVREGVMVARLFPFQMALPEGQMHH